MNKAALFMILAALLATTVEVQAAQVVISWSWKKESKIGIWTSASGKVFIVVTASIWVSGYSDFNTNPFNFKLDADSTSYSHSIATYSLPDHFTDGVIPDGGTRTGTIVFEVLQTAYAFQLRYERIFKTYNIQYRQRGRCIIATAAYGSDLAPEVQLLRTFRDQKLLSTFAGSQFMKVFDTFYYSFSPATAEIVASNPIIAQVTHKMLLPLIHILKILTSTPASEVEVVVTGLVATALVGATYLTLPLALLIASSRPGEDARKDSVEDAYS